MQGPIRVLVTGANKGIGYGIIEYSLQKAGVNTYHFLLGSRDLQRGEEARQKLITQFPGAAIEVVTLEVTSEVSAQALVAHLQKTGPLDIFINNAGIAPDKPGNLGEEVMKEVQSVNYHSPRRLIDLLLQHQLIKQNGKILNVSSILAKFNTFGNRDAFTKEALGNYSSGLTYQDLDSFVARYEKEVAAPATTKDWTVVEYTYYCHSKNFLSVYTYLLGQDERTVSRGIQVYSADPGWCATDMTKGSAAPLTYLDGAKTPFYLMQLPFQISAAFQGNLFSESAILDL